LTEDHGGRRPDAWQRTATREGRIVFQHPVISLISDVGIAGAVYRNAVGRVEAGGPRGGIDAVEVGLAQYQIGGRAIGEARGVIPGQNPVGTLIGCVDAIGSYAFVERNSEGTGPPAAYTKETDETSKIGRVIVAIVGSEVCLSQHQVRGDQGWRIGLNDLARQLRNSQQRQHGDWNDYSYGFESADALTP